MANGRRKVDDWCTSEFKRGPGGRVLTQLRREQPGHILSVFGFRAEESPARAKRKPLAPNTRFGRQGSEVWDWLPAHPLNTAEVWQSIVESRVPHHHAYDLGMPRLSCVFCIFATEEALLLAGQHNRALLDEYCAAEEAMGHDFQHGLSLRHIRSQLEAGRTPDLTKIRSWNM
jgi:3'-phosphoadenosine 5'-phosphosulfate sulfotransferase (PAPS reductase)/FAD synthetase